MPVVVQKYGGTSVADSSRIKAVADRVVETRGDGNSLVVVVSAMGQTTDSLLQLASEVSTSPQPREMDMLLTAGERISMALLAMALNDRGVPAVSYTGSQAGILTNSAHGEARITRITGERVKESLGAGKVVIVAGFQGVDPDSREITTLGRGGSDTTAVALAATLGAESCEILTDVAGVFTADPRVVDEALLLDEIGYEQMQALTASGAGVLMPHSVEFARVSMVPVHVRSSFTREPGTWITAQSPPRPFAGIAHNLEPDRGTVTIVGTEAERVVADEVERLDRLGVPSTLIESGSQAVTLSVRREQTEEAVRLLHTQLIQMEALR